MPEKSIAFERPSFAAKVMLVVLFVFGYLNPPFFWDGAYLSGFYFLLLCLFLFTTQISPRVSVGAVFLCSLMFFFLIVGHVGSGFDFSKGLVAWGQFALGFFCFLCAVKFAARFDVRFIESLYFYLMLLLVFGCFLEVYLGLDKVSDLYRLYVYAGTNFLYAADFRDIAIAGHIRPKFFTSEPSHVAKMFFVLSVGFSFVTRNKIRLSLWAIGCLLMYYFLGSLTVILALASGGAIQVYKKSGEGVRSLLVFLGVLSLVLILVFSSRFIYSDYFDLSTISSFNIRFAYPVHNVLQVLSERPFFGYGLGNKETVFEESYISSLVVNKVGVEKMVSVGNNAFFGVVIYMGVVGFVSYAVFSYFLARLSLKIDRLSSVVFVMFLLVFLTQVGAFETIQTWFYIFVVAAAMSRIMRREYA